MTTSLENMEVDPEYFDYYYDEDMLIKHSKIMKEVEERHQRIMTKEEKPKITKKECNSEILENNKKIFPSPFAAAVATAESLWGTQGNSISKLCVECPIGSIETTEDIPVRIICHPMWNSKMRSKEFGCLEFGVTWRDSSTTVEPIWNLIDIDDKSVNEKLYPLLRYYHESTLRYPNTKRQCWFCKRWCNKGKDICYAHSAEMKWMYSAITPDISGSDSEDFAFVDPLGIRMRSLTI